MIVFLLAALVAATNPTYRCDPTLHATAYRVDWRVAGDADWHRGPVWPCVTLDDGALSCPVADHDFPAARAFWPAAPLAGVDYELCVKAVNAAGESAHCAVVGPVRWEL